MDFGMLQRLSVDLLEVPWLSQLLRRGQEVIVQTLAQKLQSLIAVQQLLLPSSHRRGRCAVVRVENPLSNRIMRQEPMHRMGP